VGRPREPDHAPGLVNGQVAAVSPDIWRRHPLESKMLLDLRFVGNAKCSGAGLRFPGFIRSRFDWMNTSWTRCLRFVRQWVLTFYRGFPEPRSDEADEKAALRRLERVSYAAGVAAVGFGSRGDFTFPSRPSAPPNLSAARRQAIC